MGNLIVRTILVLQLYLFEKSYREAKTLSDSFSAYGFRKPTLR